MKWLAIVALMLMSFLGTIAQGADVALSSQWSISAGSDRLEQRAAADLQTLLREEQGLDLSLSGANALGQSRIIIGTPDDHPAISAEHRARPFRFQELTRDGYHMAYRNGSLYIVGASAKGAMNGTFRLLDHLADRGSLEIGYLDEALSPAFRDRVGGDLMNQHPPKEFSELDRARAYARHYINVAWGEKHGPPLSLEARKAYGLGLMVEVKLPPEFDGSRDYLQRPENASASYYHKGNDGRRVLDPFDPVGKAHYLRAYRDLLEQNPDTSILYALFGDYSVIPGPESRRVSDGREYGHTRLQTMQQIMRIMGEATAGREITCVGWLWHGFFGMPPEAEQQFMAWCRDNGFGTLYNEAGNNDNWLIKRDNFAKTALLLGADGKSLWGEKYYPLVSVGGACESINPVIAMPLPAVAAHKMKRLADAGVKNVVLWWGSAEGWIYNANLEVFSRMVWEPGRYQDGQEPLDPQSPDPLLANVARAGFGKSAAKVLEYWRDFDHALVSDGPLYQPADEQVAPDVDGLHINDWYQRMGSFTETVFSQAFAQPLTRESLATHEQAKKGSYWGTHDKTLANYRFVTMRLAAAQQKLAQLLNSGELSPGAQVRAKGMYLWSELYRTLLLSQRNYLRALRAVHGRNGQAPPADEGKALLDAAVADELRNIDEMIAVLEQLPENANIRQPHLGVKNNQGSTADEIALLRDKAAAMRMADAITAKAVNLALNKPVKASSEKTENGQTFSAKLATDGNMETRWASTFRDREWLAVDLGSPQEIAFVRIHWKTAYAKDFEIQVSDAASPPSGDEGWRTVHHARSGNAEMSLISLEQPVRARQVRLKTNKQATAWGYSIREFEVFGR